MNPRNVKFSVIQILIGAMFLLLVSCEIPEPPSFELRAAESLQVAAGDSVSSEISVERTDFTLPLTFSLTAVDGMSGQFSEEVSGKVTLTISTNATVSPDTYEITVVAEAGGMNKSLKITIEVNPALPGGSPPVIGNTSTEKEGLKVTLSTSVSDADGNLAELRVDWGDGQTDTLNESFAAIELEHDYTDYGSYTVTVTALDTEGASDTLEETVTLVEPEPVGERVRVTVRSVSIPDPCEDLLTGPNGELYGDITINGFLVLDIYNGKERSISPNTVIPINQSREFDYFYDEGGHITLAGKLLEADDFKGDDLIANWNVAIPFSSEMYGSFSLTSLADCSSTLSYSLERVSFLDTKPDAAQSDKELSVLTYNVFMLPGALGTDLGQRAALIPAQVQGYDAIIFQEVFDNSVREALLGTLKADYPYRTEIVGEDDSLTIQDGGVLIVSKWPIERQAELLFGNSCSGTDCNADKGVVYARIKKGSRYYNLFGTHAQSQSSESAVRAAQVVR